MSLVHQFKLSIITVHLNNRNGLQKTIESVINQTHQDFERIVIDGGFDRWKQRMSFTREWC